MKTLLRILLAAAIVVESLAASLIWVNNPWYNADDLGTAAGYPLSLFAVPALLGLLLAALLMSISRLFTPHPLLPKRLALPLGALSAVFPFLLWLLAATFFDIDC